MRHLSQHWPLQAGWTRWLIAGLAVVALIAVLAVFDAPISRFGQGLPEPVVAFAAWITRFGQSDWILYPSLGLWVVSGLLAAAIPKPVPRRALWQMAGIWAFIFIGVGFPGLVTTLIKRIVGRARPEHLDAVGTLQFQWNWTDWSYQSFPSGHTTTAFALCFVVSFLRPRWYPAMLVFAVLIALSRVVLGAHYATDLVAGAVVGTLGAYLVRNVFAARRWVFTTLPDGSIATRPMAAVSRLMSESARKRREPRPPRP